MPKHQLKKWRLDMTQQLEFEGSNIEKAAMSACEKLNIPREKLQYQVISYGSTGIFGLVGTKKAKIRVFLPKEKIEKKDIQDSPVQEDEALAFNDDVKKTIPLEQRKVDTSSIQNEDPKTVGLNFLQQIIDIMSAGAEISVEAHSDQLLFNIKSCDAAVLIGKRGQTLEAIQYLTEKIINKHYQHRLYIQVDVEDYLKKRQENLQDLAARMAEKASRTKKPISIGKMSAYERRIVHLSLKEDNRVRTQSKGDGYLRRLIIFPVRNHKNKKSSENHSTQT
jgi:spoIIIJ-associated protein